MSGRWKQKLLLQRRKDIGERVDVLVNVREKEGRQASKQHKSVSLGDRRTKARPAMSVLLMPRTEDSKHSSSISGSRDAIATRRQFHSPPNPHHSHEPI